MFRELVCAAALLWSGQASAQACCAGSGIATPGRLAVHEVALVGVQARAALVTGSFDPNARYRAAPAGASELDLEQDVFGSVRPLRRLQLAALLPFVETRRTAGGLHELGGGIGDLNVAARVDLTDAGARRFVPGIALLGGVTFPTGRPPDAAGLGALATGATGIGAYQVSFGLAVEQTVGPWFLALSGYVAERTARTVGDVHEHLGPQGTVLGTVGYVTPSELTFAVNANYTFETAAAIQGVRAPGTARTLTRLSVAGALPLGDRWRAQASIFDDLQLPELGRNQPASVGLLFALLAAWT